MLVGLGRLLVIGPADFLWQDWLVSWWPIPFTLWLGWTMLHVDAKMRLRQNRVPELGGLASWFALSLWIVPLCIIPGYLVEIALVHGWRLSLNSHWVPVSFPITSFAVYGWFFGAYAHLASRYLVSRRLVAAYMLLASLLNCAILALPHQSSFWEHEYDPSNKRAYLNLTQALFEKQQAVWEEQTRAVLLERKGVLDVYGLVFSPYASQDVFRRESTMVADVLRRHFDAEGRLLHLLNHAETGETFPWATPENLERGIDVLAKRMDRERDVLIIYLTSHGAQSSELSAYNWPLNVLPVTAESVRKMLDASSVRNRIVIVSACYSGSWIPPLSNASTLILTAADSENTSYGCGSLSELTFFGRALFDEQLRQTHSFKTAFEKAREDIKIREKEVGKEDYSNPQIFIGEEIMPVLEALEKRLDKLR